MHGSIFFTAIGTMRITVLINGTAFDFRLWLGGERRINAYCHNLALTGGRRMAEIFGTRLMDDTPEGTDFTANMVNVQLPLSPLLRETRDIVHWVDGKLLSRKYNVYGLVYQHGRNDEWWVRCCAQVWNEVRLVSNALPSCHSFIHSFPSLLASVFEQLD